MHRHTLPWPFLLGKAWKFAKIVHKPQSAVTHGKCMLFLLFSRNAANRNNKWKWIDKMRDRIIAHKYVEIAIFVFSCRFQSQQWQFRFFVSPIARNKSRVKTIIIYIYYQVKWHIYDGVFFFVLFEMLFLFLCCSHFARKAGMQLQFSIFTKNWCLTEKWLSSSSYIYT